MKQSSSEKIHRSRLGSWGGSVALRLPRSAAESLAMREGMTVEISVEGNALVIRSGKPAYSLTELVAAARGLNPPEAFDDGAVGSEQL
jgi:antitoxin component of MazEF toxin-antitoxin module